MIENKKKYTLISGWYGRTTTEEILKGTIATEKESNAQSGSDSAIKKIAEGTLNSITLIEKCLSLTSNQQIAFILYKKDNKVNFIIENDNDSRDIDLQGFVFQDLNDFSVPLNLKPLYGGCIDFKYASSQYPDTFISRFNSCSNNSFMRVLINKNIMDPYIKSSIEDCDNISYHVNYFDKLQSSIGTNIKENDNLFFRAIDNVLGSTEKGQISQITTSNSINEWSNLKYYLEEYLSKILRNQSRLVKISIEVSEFAQSEILFELSKLKSLDYQFPLNFSDDISEIPIIPKFPENSPIAITEQIKRFFSEDQLSIYRKFYTIDLLGVLFGMSPIDLPGIKYIWEPSLCVNLPNETETNPIQLGTLYQKGSSIGNFNLPISILTEHVFITGKTSSGKTNTCKVIISELVKTHQVFVIESAKNEYAYWANDNKENVDYYVPSNSKYKQLRFPLFELPIVKENNRYKTQIDISEHIGGLWNIISSAFPLEGPLIPLLRRALNNVYNYCGWETTGHDANYYLDPGEPKFPDIPDLCSILKNLIDELGYAGELRANIEAALINRLQDLMTGARKYIFSDNTKGVSILDLFEKEKSAVINLDNLTSQEDKSLALGVFLLRLREHSRLEGIRNDFLKKLIVIEEAHRLIPNVKNNSSIDPSIGRSKEEAVSSFNDAISEMSSYGVGFIIIDQSPSKVSLDVLRNIGTKIVHSVQEEDDRKSSCSILGEDIQMGSFLVGLDRGFALVHSRGMQRSALVRINKNDTENHLPKEITNNLSIEVQNNSKTLLRKIILELILGNSILEENNHELNSLRRQFSYDYHQYGIDLNKSLLMNWNNIVIGDESSGLDISCNKCMMKCRVPVITRLIKEREKLSSSSQKENEYSPLETAKSFFELIKIWKERTIQICNNENEFLIHFINEMILEKNYSKNYIFLNNNNNESEINTVDAFTQCIYLHCNYYGPLKNIIKGAIINDKEFIAQSSSNDFKLTDDKIVNSFQNILLNQENSNKITERFLKNDLNIKLILLIAIIVTLVIYFIR